MHSHAAICEDLNTSLSFGSMTENALPLPPGDLIEDGSSEVFLQVGSRFLGHLINLAALTPESNVLDLGSGSGRLAFPLTNHLSNAARYEGVDIVEAGVSLVPREHNPALPQLSVYARGKRRRKAETYVPRRGVRL